MLRREARQVAKELQPEGFELDTVTLSNEGEWKATYINDEEPPKVVIERWDDYYTEGDPEPETDDETDEAEATTEGDESDTTGEDGNTK